MGPHLNFSVSSAVFEETLSKRFRVRSLAAFPGLSAPSSRLLLEGGH